MILISIALLSVLFLLFNLILYFIPPPVSMIEFTIENYKGKWNSSGAEAVGYERYISFYVDKSQLKDFDSNYMTIAFKEPVTPKSYDLNNSRIDFWKADDSNYALFDKKNSKTDLKIDLIRWSDKPRGLIEGNIQATLYDFKGKEYKMKGYFKAYQALGTINSFH